MRSIFGAGQANATLTLRIGDHTHVVEFDQVTDMDVERHFAEHEIPGQFFTEVKPTGEMTITLKGHVKEEMKA